MSIKKRILIVDDNASNVEIIEDLLGEENLTETAASGEECLKKAIVFKPDLILLDIMMPGMDGYETCQRLRHKSTLSHTKIIMVSAKAMTAERLKGYEVGADDYITKPFDKEELRAKVRVYLKLKTVEETDAMKTNLLNLLSYEMGNPLSGIKGFGEMLLKTTSLEEEQKKDLQMIMECADQLLAFSRKISMLTELERGNKELGIFPNPLNPVIAKAIRNLSPIAGKKDVKLTFAGNGEIKIPFDDDMMPVAIANIIENAIRYSPQRGEVCITAQADDDNCVIKVSDQGPWIKEEYLEKIFDVYAEQDLAHHKVDQGLSLAIAWNIVELHGGSLTARNNPDKGTVFTFTLPVNR